MVRADPDWWKTLFDELYLITDARTVCDERLTSREVNFLVQSLKLDRSWPILDLCGGHGRHSLELSRRGFRDITVLEYSKALINLGRERAKKEGLNITFVQKDARDTGFPSQIFRIIIVMGSSFGYIIDEKENKRILSEAFRLLMHEGSLLLDLPNREYVLMNLKLQSWHEANEEIVVCRQRKVDNDVIYSREMVISRDKGLIRDANYCICLYSPEKITALLKSAGFDSVTIQDNFVSSKRNGDYGLMTNRMIVTAGKGL